MVEARTRSPERVDCSPNETPTSGNRRNRVWLKLLALLLLIGITIVLYQTNVFRFFFSRQEILEFLDSLGPLGFAGFILLQAAQVVLAPIPGEITGLIGGFLYGPVLGVALSTVGLVLGSFIAFSLSRTFGRPFIEKFIDPSIMARFDYLLHHKGLFLIFVLFLIPGFPKDYLCLILGLGHLTTFEFLMVSSVGRLFGTILLTLGGGFIRYEQYGKLSVLIGITALFAVFFYIFRDRVERGFQVWHARHHCKKSVGRSSSIV